MWAEEDVKIREGLAHQPTADNERMSQYTEKAAKVEREKVIERVRRRDDNMKQYNESESDEHEWGGERVRY